MQDNCVNEIKFTAILPNYNSVEFLPKSLASLLNQTVPFDEIIIVDDGSTDHSVQVIQAFMQENPHIQLIRHEKNQGVNPALNTGLAHATGDYVLLCAADDWYAPNMVELAKKVIQKHPHIGVVCGDAVVHRFDLKEPFYRMLPYPADQVISPEEFREIAKKTYVGFNSGGGMFMNRETVLKAGKLHNPTRWHGDWLLYFVVAFMQGIYYINREFIHISMRKASYSEGKSNLAIQNQVMIDTVNIINQYYPELWNDFRDSALLPHYAIRYIRLFRSDPIGNKFMTKRLMWKMFINNPVIVKIGRLFPYQVILGMRKLLRA